MADRTPQDAMPGTATGLTGYELWLLRRSPATVDSITSDNFFGPNPDQAARGNHTHSLATTAAPGFLSTNDKAKLDAFDTARMLPSGGTAGQILAKASPTNYHVTWINPPSGGTGGGTSAGWAQFGTAASLTTANPTMAAGTSGYETDTFRWKLGDGVRAWNSLPYQDQPQTPAVITNPGATVSFSFRPLATQVINYTSVSSGATLTSTMNIPSGAPATGHEGTMFIRATNNSLGTVNFQIAAGITVVGDAFDGVLSPNEAIEFSLWVVHGIWYAEGTSDITAGSVENQHLADMATGTFKGRVSAGTGAPEDLSAGQVRAAVDYVAPLTVTVATSTALTRAAHQGRTLICTAAVNLTVTTSTDFDQHTQCVIWAQGGAVTVVASATVNTASTLIIPQHAVGILQRSTSSDTYSLAWIGRPTDMAKISPEAGNEFNGNIWAGPAASAGTTAGTLYFMT